MSDATRQVYETARLGDMIRYFDGTPRPPDRFTKKLRAWEKNNSGGYLISKDSTPYYGPTFKLEKKLSGSIASVIAKYTTVVPLTNPLKFEIISCLPVGTWRVIRLLTTGHELEF